jgi:membrane associated rhomboid family serine protease
MRRAIRQPFMQELWLKVRDTAPAVTGLPSRRCPSCRHPMRVAVVKGLDAVPIDMDVCPRCQIVWLDSDEVEALPRITSDESISSPEARVRAATIEARLMRARTTREAFARPRGAFWNTLAGMFGYRADDNSTVEWRLPLLTAGLATLILGGFIISMIPGAAFMEKWGLLPGEPWRHAGLDWVASAFLHAGFLHFIVSFCFLLIIGKSVENLIGRARCLVLIFTGQILAGAVHVAFDSHSLGLVLGMGGGLSTIVGFHACALPHVRLDLVPSRRLWQWILQTSEAGHPIHVPVGWAFAAWWLFQFFGAWAQWPGFSLVSALAGLVAALAGIGLGLWWRRRLPQVVEPVDDWFMPSPRPLRDQNDPGGFKSAR